MLRERIVELGVGRFDDQPAARRHRVLGIDRQVQDHLFDLRRIGDDLVEIGRRVQHELDLFAD